MLEIPAAWIESTPPWLVYLIPLFAFVESCLGIGLFVSGIFLLSLSVLLYGQELVSIPTIAICAFIGALAGDLTGFLVGKSLGPRLKGTKLFRRQSARIDYYESRLADSAMAAICSGRFIPAIRSIMPMLAGISGLSSQRYLRMEVMACALWVVALCILVRAINSSLVNI